VPIIVSVPQKRTGPRDWLPSRTVVHGQRNVVTKHKALQGDSSRSSVCGGCYGHLRRRASGRSCLRCLSVQPPLCGRQDFVATEDRLFPTRISLRRGAQRSHRGRHWRRHVGWRCEVRRRTDVTNINLSARSCSGTDGSRLSVGTQRSAHYLDQLGRPKRLREKFLSTVTTIGVSGHQKNRKL
jgi:hypothetical protein